MALTKKYYKIAKTDEELSLAALELSRDVSSSLGGDVNLMPKDLTDSNEANIENISNPCGTLRNAYLI